MQSPTAGDDDSALQGYLAYKNGTPVLDDGSAPDSGGDEDADENEWVA